MIRHQAHHPALRADPRRGLPGTPGEALSRLRASLDAPEVLPAPAAHTAALPGPSAPPPDHPPQGTKTRLRAPLDVLRGPTALDKET